MQGDILEQAMEAVKSGKRISVICDFIRAWDAGDMDIVIDISCKAIKEDKDLADILDDIETAFCEQIHADEGMEATDDDEERIHAKAKELLKQYTEEVH